MRVMRLVLLTTTAIVTPTLALADPVSAFVAGFTGATGFAASTALGSVALAVGNFLGQNIIGSILLNIGIAALLRPDQPGTPKIEAAQVNARLADAPRYQLGGPVKVGGAAGAFAEYDEDGNFWYFVLHGDAEMVSDPQYYLDGIPVELAEYDQTLTDPVDAVSDANVDLSDPPATIGGTPLEDEDRVLLKDQADPIENGIYTWAPGSPNVMARAADLAASDEVGKGFAVQEASLGPTYPGNDGSGLGTVYRVASDGVTVGTDALTWEVVPYATSKVGDVLTDEFCFNEDKEIYDGSGQKRLAYRLYTVGPSSAQVYGDLPTEFTDAFPDLPEDFYLAGVCYTIVRIRAVSTFAKPVVWRWRGPIGLGEPAVSVYANFSRMYDPREEAHDIDDPSTWTASTGNPEILWAWWRTNVWGRNQPMTAINWDEVAARADICDQQVQDRSGEYVDRYRCGFAAPDNQTRQEAEKEILLTMDAFVAYDDEGRAYAVPGDYEAPTLAFTRERDIFTGATQLVDDGEQPMDGVVVNYISPEHDYTKQPCAPWINPDFYDENREPNYLFLDVLGCQSHNQAVRLAKAAGGRQQATRRAALGTTIKGILAKRERAINLSYDAQFDGVHEIVGNVSEDEEGMACAFGVVPLDPNRWTLLEGEEGAPPAPTPSLEIDNSLTAPQNVVLTSESIATDTGSAVRIHAVFDAPARQSDVFRFRYAPAGTYSYEYFTVDMDELLAYSALVADGSTFDVQWKTVNGDRGTSWSDIEQITVTANETAPDDLEAASATGGTGETVLAWTTANDENQHAVQIRRGVTLTYGDATLISTVITPANTEGGATDSGLAAGTYYYWLTPINGSGVQGTDSGPFTSLVS